MSNKNFISNWTLIYYETWFDEATEEKAKIYWANAIDCLFNKMNEPTPAKYVAFIDKNNAAHKITTLIQNFVEDSVKIDGKK